MSLDVPVELVVNNRVLNAYIVPADEMNPIYNAQVAALILLLIILFIAALFEMRGKIKVAASVLSIIFLSINYYIYISLLKYENIYFYPLIVIEKYGENMVMSPDLGQLVLILLIVNWRRELWKTIRGLINMFMKKCSGRSDVNVEKR